MLPKYLQYKIEVKSGLWEIKKSKVEKTQTSNYSADWSVASIKLLKVCLTCKFRIVIDKGGRNRAVAELKRMTIFMEVWTRCLR